MSCFNHIPFDNQNQPVTFPPVEKVTIDNPLSAATLQNLEKIVRQKMPAQNYGYKNFILNEKNGLRFTFYPQNCLLTGERDLTAGYNCYEANQFLVQEAKKMNLPAFLVKGQDARQLFSEHYFAVVQGQPLDAVALFPFYQAQHRFRLPKKQGVFQAAEAARGSLYNPVEFLHLPNGEAVNFGIAEISQVNSQLTLEVFAAPLKKDKKRKPAFWRLTIDKKDFLAFFTQNPCDFQNFCQDKDLQQTFLQWSTLRQTTRDEQTELTAVFDLEMPVICALFYKMGFPQQFKCE